MITKPDDQNHYTWGGSCDGWILTQTQDLSVVEERMPPKSSETMHYHDKARQYFRVLSGTLSMEMDGKVFAVNPGEGIEIASNIPHRAFNDGKADCIFLVISAPSAKGDRHVIKVQSSPSHHPVKS